MNLIMLIGNLASDPELRYNNNQQPICKFTVATNDGFGARKETNFHRVVCFGKTAENCDKYLVKGRKCAVRGRVKYGSYEKQDGSKVYTTDIVADNVEFIGSQESKSDWPPREAAETNEAYNKRDDIPEGFQSVMDEVPW